MNYPLERSCKAGMMQNLADVEFGKVYHELGVNFYYTVVSFRKKSTGNRLYFPYFRMA